MVLCLISGGATCIPYIQITHQELFLFRDDRRGYDDRRDIGGGGPPRNNRWVEDDRDRSSGGGGQGGGRWQDRGNDRDDWSQPLARNEVLEAELFNNVGPSVSVCI